TTAPPPAHYGAVKGALASGFATAELHHLWGHDLYEGVACP
ncbi:EAL domain-containing protein, partial [Sinorhizobium meliloti]